MMNPREDGRALDAQHNFFNDVIQECSDESFHEMTGKKGDVILMHPLTLHSASKNGRRKIRRFSQSPELFQTYVGGKGN